MILFFPMVLTQENLQLESEKVLSEELCKTLSQAEKGFTDRFLRADGVKISS